MDNPITELLENATKVTDSRAQALEGLLAFLHDMEDIGCGPAEQWERVQALQDEAFKTHLTRPASSR
jgi:hypothetical protein